MTTRDRRDARRFVRLAPLVVALSAALVASSSPAPAAPTDARRVTTAAPPPAPAPTAAPPPAPVSNEAALASFGAIARVLQSPRCVNCHPVGDAPMRGDAAARHRMNVSRRSAEAGLPCTTCHQGRNGNAERSPPGVPDWHMPGAATPMVFQGKTPRELCEQLKDPQRNGGKSLEQLREHLDHDPLVMWGWSPGPGRTLPPISHDELVVHVTRWLGAGAPCPM